jgi:8-oxo-dGTP diphosphatase
LASSSAEHCLRCGTVLVSRAIDHRERPTCPACGWTLFLDPKVAAAAVLELNGGILLCRRAIEPGFGKWSFPAGFVDRGEVVEEALRREIREETGLDAALDGLVGVYSHAGNPVVLIVYAAHASGTPRTSPEASELGVFSPSTPPELAFEHDQNIIHDWKERRRG